MITDTKGYKIREDRMVTAIKHTKQDEDGHNLTRKHFSRMRTASLPTVMWWPPQGASRGRGWVHTPSAPCLGIGAHPTLDIPTPHAEGTWDQRYPTPCGQND